MAVEYKNLSTHFHVDLYAPILFEQWFGKCLDILKKESHAYWNSKLCIFDYIIALRNTEEFLELNPNSKVLHSVQIMKCHSSSQTLLMTH